MKLLSDIAAELKTRTPLIGLSDTLDTTPTELIPLVKEFGFEGVLAKRSTSGFRTQQDSNRSGETKTATCLAQVAFRGELMAKY